tara:strand:+ start:399 stop:1310 length:912 start_codon:yes stop_codon:yes gene_type:complete
MIDIFIPSYHRPDNIKTAKYFIKKGYEAKKIHIFIDDEADDRLEYKEAARKLGFNLYVFSMEIARERFDYIHRASVSRRSAGQARNMFYDFAKELGLDFYLVMDDDTTGFEIRPYGVYNRIANIDEIQLVFNGIRDFMNKHKIGVFGLSQTGDMFARTNAKLLRGKVMNTTFIDTRFICRGERGIQDNDTSQFVGLMNEGYFTGSLASGLVLKQTSSATASGGLTEIYNECKLLNKSLIVPIQFPSLCHAEKQKKNGGRLHHRINNRYLAPRIIKGKRSNIAWDSFPEDVPFTNEPIRNNGTK